MHCKQSLVGGAPVSTCIVSRAWCIASSCILQEKKLCVMFVLFCRLLRPDCQMVLFSATYNEDVMRFAQKGIYMYTCICITDMLFIVGCAEMTVLA